MPRIINFEGRRITVPDDATDDEIRGILSGPTAAPAADAPQPAAAPTYQSPAADAALRDAPARDPAFTVDVGVQGAGKGLAEFAGFLPDMTNALVNLALAGGDKASQALGGPAISYRFPSTSQELANTGSRLTEAVGGEVRDYEGMSGAEKLVYNTNRFGAQGAAALPALVGRGITRGVEIAAGSAPKALDALVRPYMGENIARPIAGDAAAAAGAGAGVTAADEAGFQDNPLVQMLAALAGGVGGVTALGGAEKAVQGAKRAAGKVVGADIDKSVPVDPETRLPVPKSVSDRAAAVVQGEAVNPADAAARMRGNAQELRSLDDRAPMPSPAGLSEDPGLAALERRVALSQPGPAMARQREFASGVRDTIDRVAPEGADASALVSRVQSVADARTGAAQRAVEQAEGQSRGLEIARQGEAERTVAPFAGRDVQASQRLDRAVVDEGYLPARAEKNRQFDEAPGATQELPIEDVAAAAARVRASINQLGPERVQLPAEFVQRIERLAPDVQQQPSPILGADGQPVMRDVNVGGPGTAQGGDLADVRKYLGTAYEQAQRSGNFDLADNIQALRRAINRTIEDAPGYAEANANYREFAGAYRPGPNDEAAKFTRAIDRDPQRGSTPPSQTAGRFLQRGAPEKREALQRILDASPDGDGGRAAAREFLMADLASSGVIDQRAGVLRPDRLRRWQQQWGDLDGVVPGFGRDLRDMTARADRGERLAGQFAHEARDAQIRAKQTQDQIDKGAFGLVLNSDPDKAVAAVMDQKNRTGRLMDELIRVTDSDPQARNGLKAAVRDYLVDKATTGASEKLRPGDRRGPVSQAKLSALFREHEKELARVFDADEMNALRAGHKALELANIERLRVTSGSDTAEKIGVVDKLLGTSVGKGLEAFLRLKYGTLKAGGIIATGRRMTAGMTDQSAAEVARLVERAAFDPELMQLLLGRKIPVASPRWNAKLNRLMGYGEGAREVNDDE